MVRAIIFSIIFFANLSYGDEELDEAVLSLQKENLFEIMAYGFGAAEAITNLGKKSDGGNIASDQEPNVFLPIVIETIEGITVKRIQKKSGDTFLAELNVTKGAFTIPFGGNLSTLTKEEAISSLGKPAEISQNELKYYVPSQMDDNILIITFEEEYAKSIKWVWWIL